LLANKEMTYKAYDGCNSVSSILNFFCHYAIDVIEVLINAMHSGRSSQDRASWI